MRDDGVAFSALLAVLLAFFGIAEPLRPKPPCCYYNISGDTLLPFLGWLFAIASCLRPPSSSWPYANDRSLLTPSFCWLFAIVDYTLDWLPSIVSPVPKFFPCSAYNIVGYTPLLSQCCFCATDGFVPRPCLGWLCAIFGYFL